MPWAYTGNFAMWFLMHHIAYLLPQTPIQTTPTRSQNRVIRTAEMKSEETLHGHDSVKDDNVQKVKSSNSPGVKSKIPQGERLPIQGSKLSEPERGWERQRWEFVSEWVSVCKGQRWAMLKMSISQDRSYTPSLSGKPHCGNKRCNFVFQCGWCIT